MTGGRLVRVVVDLATSAGDRAYTYRVPEDVGPVTPGVHVWVPFGRRRLLGVVWGEEEASPQELAVRDVLGVAEELEPFPPTHLALAEYLASRTVCYLPQAVRALRPPRVSRRPRGGGGSQSAGHAPETDQVRAAPLTPTGDQERAIAALHAAVESGGFHGFLVHGVTGSGKTEVYLRVLERVLEKGRGAIVLVPEIALTPQTLERFRARCGSLVEVLHSRLTERERAAAWRRLARGEARVALGPRSAALAPVRNLGLVVVDEEHEPSYQQEDIPRYHAGDVAEWRARVEGAVLVYGSATPRLEMYVRAERGELDLLSLPFRANRSPLPRMRVVDMRREVRGMLLSAPLVDAVDRTLAEGRQVILFLNRRGYAPAVVCRDCGHVPRCPHCDVSLTVHRQEGILLCHYCGRRQRPPSRCPVCGGGRLRTVGFGTQRVEEEVRLRWPSARVARMDLDTTRGRMAYARLYEAVRRGDVDVLVGTQMVAKGFDFPGVTLVGVVAADLSLAFPDFRAGERTFQLLTQVAGRAGRGDSPGEVIVQTYQPEHYALAAAVQYDYHGFARTELALRQELRFPPFSHLLRVGVSGPDAQQVQRAAEEVAAAVAGAGVEVLGPAPALVPKVKDRVRWHVLARSPSREALVQVAREEVLPRQERGRGGVNVQIILDPMHLL